MEKRRAYHPWMLTVITQVCLCFGLYMAFNLGNPQVQQQQPPHSPVRSVINRQQMSSPLDYYFISLNVAASFSNHSRLLNLLETLINAYDPKFVINVADTDLPLFNNDTRNSQLSRVPWYTTTASKEQSVDFVKKIEFPLGKTLDIIAMNTGILVDSSSMSQRDQVQQRLARILKTADSHWCFVIGSHPLDVCKRSPEQQDMKQIYEPLHKIFLKMRT